MVECPEGTVTFLFTDVAGSTRLWEQQSEGMRRALARHDAILRQSIEGHGGCVFKTVGDGFMAAFTSAPPALTAAVTAQRMLRTVPDKGLPQLRVRMAIHTGTAEERSSDYFGPPLNRTARLLGVAHGGQILVSAAAYELARDHLPPNTGVRDLGEHRLPDLGRADRVYQLLHPELPADFPPLESLDLLPNNLPLQLTGFIGRERELDDISRMLQRHRLVTLTGPGGVGKTRLALQVGAASVGLFQHGVWLVDLAPLADPLLVPQAAASALGAQQEPERDVLGTLADYLKQKRLLLILDNCEHIVQGCASLADALLRACPPLRILATGREPLRIAGEVTYDVPPLSFPDVRRLSRGTPVGEYEAVRLFVDRASAVRPQFRLIQENAPDVARICERLDGIPLAIELAAAWIRALSAKQIADRLDRRFDLLKEGSHRGARPGHETLRAVIDASHELLSEVERVLFRRLSVFCGGWTADAAEMVCSGQGMTPSQTLETLFRLVSRSLAVSEDGLDGMARFRMLETIREYAVGRLRDAGETAGLRRAHWEFYVSLAEEAEPRLAGPEQALRLALLDAEHDNCRSAMDAAIESGDRLAVARLAAALWRFWDLRGYFTEGRHYLGAALAPDAPTLDVTTRARLLHGAGVLAWHQGDYREARLLYSESLALWRETGDEAAMAETMVHLGWVARSQREHDEARELFTQSAGICGKLGTPACMAAALSGLGMVAHDQDEFEQAASYHRESLEIERDLGNQAAVSMSLNRLGLAAYAQADYAAARRFLEEALALRRSLGDRPGVASSLHNLGLVAQEEGEYGQARALLEESLQIEQELGRKRDIAISLECLGEVALLQGGYADARRLHERSLALKRELGDRAGTAASLCSLGVVAQHEGDFAQARSLLESSLSSEREIGNRWGVVRAMEALAGLELAEGGDAEHARSAVLLLASADSLRRSIRAPLPPSRRPEHERRIHTAREILGEARFEQVWAEGRDMNEEQWLSRPWSVR